MPCGFHIVVPVFPASSPEPDVPPGGKTRLVSKSGVKPVYTDVHTTDARTALTRGLAEYLGQLQVEWEGGRQVLFKHVLESWAEPEELAEYPSAIVYAMGPGTYDASKFTPEPTVGMAIGNGLYLVSPSEYVLDIAVEVWATDPEERMALVSGLEEAMCPLDWMYGLRLELPHYHSTRAEYELLSGAYLDSADDAKRRHRRAGLTVRARVPVLRTVARQKMRAKPVVEVT